MSWIELDQNCVHWKPPVEFVSNIVIRRPDKLINWLAGIDIKISSKQLGSQNID
jgi:hypothetical protein